MEYCLGRFVNWKAQVASNNVRTRILMNPCDRFVLPRSSIGAVWSSYGVIEVIGGTCDSY